MEQNSSGQGKDSIVPQEANFYNFGAELFGYFWLVGNGLARADVQYNLRIYEGINPSPRYIRGLGVKGNNIAWKYRHWDSLEKFVQVQKRWSLFGITTLILFVAISITAYLGFYKLFSGV